MFKNQPKGLIAAFWPIWRTLRFLHHAMAILTLFISAVRLPGRSYGGLYLFKVSMRRSGLLALEAVSSPTGPRTISRRLCVHRDEYRLVAHRHPDPDPGSQPSLYLTLPTRPGLLVTLGNGLFKATSRRSSVDVADNSEFSAKRESASDLHHQRRRFFAPRSSLSACVTGGSRSTISDYNAKLLELCHEYLAASSDGEGRT